MWDDVEELIEWSKKNNQRHAEEAAKEGVEEDEEEVNKAEEFRKAIKQVDQSWLQKTVESVLIGMGYTSEGAELTTAAGTIINGLEIVGPLFLL